MYISMKFQYFNKQRFNALLVPTVQPKLDGTRALCSSVGADERIFTTQNNKLIQSCNHILSQIEKLDSPHNVIFDGELYSHSLSRENLHSRISRTVIDHIDSESVSYFIFDAFIPGQEMNQLQRWKLIPTFTDNTNTYASIPQCYQISTNVFLLKGVHASTYECVLNYNLHYLASSCEGMIVRCSANTYRQGKRVKDVLKFKPHQTDTYTIFAMHESLDEDNHGKNMVGSFICIDENGEQFTVGSSTFTDEQKQQLWARRESLLGQSLTVRYQRLSCYQVPLESVAIEINSVKI